MKPNMTTLREAFSAIDWSAEVPRLFKTGIALFVVLNALYLWLPTELVSAIIGVLYGSGLWIVRTDRPPPEPTPEVKK